MLCRTVRRDILHPFGFTGPAAPGRQCLLPPRIPRSVRGGCRCWKCERLEALIVAQDLRGETVSIRANSSEVAGAVLDHFLAQNVQSAARLGLRVPC